MILPGQLPLVCHTGQGYDVCDPAESFTFRNYDRSPYIMIRAFRIDFIHKIEKMVGENK